MIKHKKVEKRKKYVHGRGLVIVNKRRPLIVEDPKSNAKKAASEIKNGQGFQVI